MVAQSDSRQPCTILLPLFNGANFLGRSIDNLCKIAGPQDEILIIENAIKTLSSSLKAKDTDAIIQHTKDLNLLTESFAAKIINKITHANMRETFNNHLLKSLKIN